MTRLDRESMPGGLMIEKEVTLYQLPSIKLATLAVGKDRQTFLDDLAAAAEESGDGKIAIRIELLSQRVLRVERRENQLPIAVHFIIMEASSAVGTTIRLQPLTAWRPSFGGGAGSDILPRTIAETTIAELRAELPPLAGSVL
jgi:hypothetical protein